MRSSREQRSHKTFSIFRFRVGPDHELVARDAVAGSADFPVGQPALRYGLAHVFVEGPDIYPEITSGLFWGDEASG